MNRQRVSDQFEILIPNTRGKKELRSLYERRKKQTEKAINKLKISPLVCSSTSGIEKIKHKVLGDYSIRVSKGERIFYSVDEEKKKVLIIRAGKHDLYKLSQ